MDVDHAEADVLCEAVLTEPLQQVEAAVGHLQVDLIDRYVQQPRIYLLEAAVAHVGRGVGAEAAGDDAHGLDGELELVQPGRHRGLVYLNVAGTRRLQVGGLLPDDLRERGPPEPGPGSRAWAGCPRSWLVGIRGSHCHSLCMRGPCHQLQLPARRLARQELEAATRADVDQAFAGQGDGFSHLFDQASDLLQADVPRVYDTQAQAFFLGPLPQQLPVGRSLDEVEAEEPEGQLQELRHVGHVAVVGVQAERGVHPFGQHGHGVAEQAEITLVANAGVVDDGGPL